MLKIDRSFTLEHKGKELLKGNLCIRVSNGRNNFLSQNAKSIDARTLTFSVKTFCPADQSMIQFFYCILMSCCVSCHVMSCYFFDAIFCVHMCKSLLWMWWCLCVVCPVGGFWGTFWVHIFIIIGNLLFIQYVDGTYIWFDWSTRNYYQSGIMNWRIIWHAQEKLEEESCKASHFRIQRWFWELYDFCTFY